MVGVDGLSVVVPPPAPPTPPKLNEFSDSAPASVVLLIPTFGGAIVLPDPEALPPKVKFEVDVVDVGVVVMALAGKSFGSSNLKSMFTTTGVVCGSAGTDGLLAPKLKPEMELVGGAVVVVEVVVADIIGAANDPLPPSNENPITFGGLVLPLPNMPTGAPASVPDVPPTEVELDDVVDVGVDSSNVTNSTAEAGVVKPPYSPPSVAKSVGETLLLPLLSEPRDCSD